MRIACFASSTTALGGRDLLRAQINELHDEANSTRIKANSTRLRFMRLSDAAERLTRQAAIYVQSGKEDEARQLLLQKKKVIGAMEKTKSRIQCLDELSSKLNEVISLKESQIIETVASDIEQEGNEPGPVRIVFSKDESLRYDVKIANNEESYESISWESVGTLLEHIVEQLKGIEDEIISMLNSSILELDDDDKSQNVKLKLMNEVLEGVQSLRVRILEGGNV